MPVFAREICLFRYNSLKKFAIFDTIKNNIAIGCDFRQADVIGELHNAIGNTAIGI